MAKENKSLYNVELLPSTDIPEELDAFRKAGLVVSFFGGPGIGKTASIRYGAKAQADDLGLIFKENPTPDDWNDPKNYCFRVILTSQIKEEDSTGIPVRFTRADGTDVTRYLPTELFPEKGVGMILFDEFPNGHPDVQNAMQQMLLDHNAGNYSISKDIQFVLAGNRPGDNCGTYNIPDALKNRPGWYEVVRPTIPRWLEVMDKIGQPIDTRMGGWLLSIGSKYFDNHGEHAEQYAYGSPRSVTHASIAITGVNDLKIIKRRVGAFIGSDAGKSLFDFLEMTQKVDVDAILKNPVEIHNHEGDIGLMYAISCAVLDKVVDNPKLMDSVSDILLEMKRAEYGVFVIKGMMTRMGRPLALQRIGGAAKGLQVGQKYRDILKMDATAK
jgi:hypothetical protein